MNDIGSQLRQAREAREWSLEHVQKATRIKRVFLEAIEAGRFEELPGLVQARGFVRSYANLVGLDPDTLLAQIDGMASLPAGALARGNQTTPASRVASAPRPTPGAAIGSGLPLPLPVLILGVLVLFVIGGLLILQAFGGESPAPSPTAPASVPLSISLSPATTPTPSPVAGVSLTLTAREHVWVRVTHDGFTAFEGILEPGQPQTWQGEQQVIVETGNGAALDVVVNGQELGVLGPRNRVVVRAWGAQGEVTPAPTAAPPTPEATPTP
jgi:hypothetical protein